MNLLPYCKGKTKIFPVPIRRLLVGKAEGVVRELHDSDILDDGGKTCLPYTTGSRGGSFDRRASAFVQMRATMFFKFTIPLLCALLFVAHARPAAAESVPVVENLEVGAAFRVLDSWIEATRVARSDPGLSIGVVYDQHLIWEKGYGFANLEQRLPTATSTRYRLASLSKLFTATAIVQLRDAGKLELDDPVQKY